MYILRNAKYEKLGMIDDIDQHYRCAKYGVYWLKYDWNIGRYVWNAKANRIIINSV